MLLLKLVQNPTVLYNFQTRSYYSASDILAHKNAFNTQRRITRGLFNLFESAMRQTLVASSTDYDYLIPDIFPDLYKLGYGRWENFGEIRYMARTALMVLLSSGNLI